MGKLILHPTDMSQWHALVNEAQVITSLELPEHTESYLVLLLMRFMNTSSLLESVIALDLLTSMQVCGQRQVELLRDVGDKSLLFCGLFPGIAERRHLNLDYFSDMGRSAYLSVSEIMEETPNDLYSQLSNSFFDLQKVLQAMQGRYLDVAYLDSIIAPGKPDSIQ